MIGTRLEQYEVTAHLGSGGMGQVYEATDSKLGRCVAIKILPDLFAQDSDRVVRFEREARVLASLNHPHIAGLYGLERAAARIFLVMELVPGDTLAERIARSRSGLPLREVISIARQIAQALEAAHQGGVIHRDLKPANIKITPDGVVKVLDFGLAKAATPAENAADLSQSPTISNSAMTKAGVILGTAAYMSPEQTKGLQLDKRSDIWSFGCILYEMLTGVRAFEGDDVTETLAAVLMREPDWSRLPAQIPRPIERLLRSCLERDRARRMSDIAGALFGLDDIGTAAMKPPDSPTRPRLAYLGWIAAVLVTVAALVAYGLLSRRETPESATMNLHVVTPSGSHPFTFALSPDGRSMVFHSHVGNEEGLWVRDFESVKDRFFAGTGGAVFPFWSPDSLSVAFFVPGALKRIDLNSGFVRTLTTISADGRPGSWNAAGTILYSLSTGPLYKMSADGGTPEEVTALLPGQSNHRFSEFLPDNRRFLFLALGEPAVRGVYLGSLDDKKISRISEGDTPFRFLAPNFILSIRQGALWAQQFDMTSGRTQGELLPVVPEVYVHAQVTGWAALSVSGMGAIAYRPTPETRQLFWLDRSGREVGTVGAADKFQMEIMSMFPDGKAIAVRRAVNGNTDVWLMDTERGTLRRVTFDPAIDASAVVARDGSRIIYASDPKSTLWDVYERKADGTGAETLLVSNPENDNPVDISPDGRYVLYSTDNAKTTFDILALPMFGDRTPIVVAQTPASEYDARFSPDGHWIALVSDESGRDEIYIQPFPGPGPKTQISADGGRAPIWSRQGELLYRAADNRVVAVNVALGPSVIADAPRPILSLHPAESYLLSPDGQRLVVNRVVSPPPPISIILNWKPAKSSVGKRGTSQ